jgi:hypothetical protein
MFDFFKPHSVTSQLLEANRQHRTRHTKTTAFDNTAMNCKIGYNFTWSEGTRLIDARFFHDIFAAESAYLSCSEDRDSSYADQHGWVYTPSSFRLILIELNAIGIIPFVPKDNHSTFGCRTS